MDKLLKDSIEITKAAGAAIMNFYQSSFDVTDKSPDNPVTDADYAADQLLKEQLTALLPQAGWLSEETVDNHQRLNQSQVWVVDPLDGTKEFIMGIPEFAVSVGLVENGKPILGIIYNPASDEIFYVAKGGPVFFNGTPVTTTNRTQMLASTIDASRSERKRGEFEPFTDMFTIRTMGGTAYKLARVAAGMCDAAWSRGPKNEWDICAGVLLVEEAGGQCVDLSDKPFTFNRPKTLVSGFIADNGHFHEELISLLKPYGAARK